jgi:pimeloyl-ACP methyl ester carboxylesterase
MIGSFLSNTFSSVLPESIADYLTGSTPTKSVNFFIDNLEEFRKYDEELSRDGAEFVLAGHSLGGYLSANYTIKYPKHVKALILISPVGIPMLPSNEEIIPITSVGYWAGVASALINLNFTPQFFIRAMGNSGLDRVKAGLNRRFGGRWGQEELDSISNYLYDISISPSYGEVALNSLLIPHRVKIEDREKFHVYARQPIRDKLLALSKSEIHIQFIYLSIYLCI